MQSRVSHDANSTVCEIFDSDSDDSVVEIPCSQIYVSRIKNDDDDCLLKEIKDEPRCSTARNSLSTSYESDGSVVEIAGSPIYTGGSNNVDKDDCILLDIKDEPNCISFAARKGDESAVEIPDSPICPGGSNNDNAHYSPLGKIKGEPKEDENNPSPSYADCKSELNEKKPGPSLLEEAGLKADYASDENAIYVSEEIYDREKDNFDALVQETISAEKQRVKLESQGKDNRELLQAEKEVLKLNERLELMSQYMDNLRTGDQDHADKLEKETQLETDEKPSWAHLYAGVNRYRHKAEGSVAEFYQHKSNIISGLKTLFQPEGPPPSAAEFAGQPKALTVSLLHHQEVGLRWLMWRESQKISGGILADDMGLGKTLSMIALILASNEKKKQKKSFEQQLQLHKKQQSPLKRIRIFDDSDSEDEHPVLPPKREYLPPEADDDEEEDFLLSNPGRNNSACTLVISPMSVMSQWADEAVTKVNQNALKVHIYHGADRRRCIELSKFRRMDMVITSYSTAVSEYTRFGSASWLFSLEWDRLILDEAHIIRNTKTACCQAVSAIKAKCHWALTGTPIQNRALDCFALLKFLNVPNFTDLQQWRRHLNEGLDGHRRMSYLIKPLMLRRTKLQLQASGEMPPLPPLHVKLIDVILSPPEISVYKILSAISVKIFAQFLRQREQNNEDLYYYANHGRPNFIVDEIDSKYHDMYENFLRSIGYNPRARVKGIVILVLLLRLRQFCCHPGLMVKMLSGQMDESESDEEDGVENEKPGDLNFERLEEDLLQDDNKGVKTDEDKKPEEPNDKQDDTINMETAMKLLRPSNPIFEFERASAKCKLVFFTLKQLLQETNDKIIVVSQWTSFLFVIKQHLASIGHETLDFNGKMDAMQRKETLSEFNKFYNNKRILLLSLTAGGVGLNLNVANHLLMVDLHWNPQLERQAQDRIYRYGQKKTSYIYRFMCKDTVEQRIKALQDYKMEISNVVLSHDSQLPKSSSNGLSVKDMKKLFGMC
ncbi:transcription termination factor 2 [Drosophila innubila]|uniref:transcription termination factor 2 n=1 Tax=Drosophila innubila TaxID=198719 RepID=UPI00148C966C|nr:transcription termination factor 2 [Drosophila innubila]